MHHCADRNQPGQHPKDHDKIYARHEPEVYCIGKGKDHKPDEFGNKVSLFAVTAKTNIIVGVANHEKHHHDSKTLPDVLLPLENSRGKTAPTAVCDRATEERKASAPARQSEI